MGGKDGGRRRTGLKGEGHDEGEKRKKGRRRRQRQPHSAAKAHDNDMLRDRDHTAPNEPPQRMHP